MADDGGSVDAGNPGTDQGQTDWLTGASDDTRSFAETKGWGGPDEAFQSYQNLEKIIGRKTDGMVSLPTPESTPEQVGEFWQKLGRPETADGYKFEIPEGIEGADKALIPFYQQMALDANLPADVAQKVFAAQMTKLAELNTNAQQEQAAQIDGWNAELRTMFGQAYDERVGMANRAAAALGGDQADALLDMLSESGLGSFPPLVAAFAEAGKLMGEDRLGATVPSKVGGAMTPAEAQSKIDNIMGSNLDRAAKEKLPYWDDAHPDHAKSVQEVQKLYAMTAEDGDKPINAGSIIRVS